MIMVSTSKHRTALLCILLSCIVISSECSSMTATTADEDVEGSSGSVTIEDDAVVNVKSADENNLADTNSAAEEQPFTDDDFILHDEIILEPSSSSDQQYKYTPPTHFQITAHVQTNLHTGYSYFLPKESLPTSFAHLPFLECGAIGSTTEKLPLVSGVFRHVPHTAVVPKREDLEQIVLENLESESDGANGNGNIVNTDDENLMVGGLDELNQDDGDSVGVKSNETDSNNRNTSAKDDHDHHPKRPSPPKYVVALSPLEITVGGGGRNGNGININNETQKFNAGDVIFVEDTWWGVWDDSNESHDEESSEQASQSQAEEHKMKGYIMRASPEELGTDLNVLVLTVPNAIHRHWKNAQYAMAMAKREQQQQQREAQKQQHQSSQPQRNTPIRNPHEFGTRQPWWKRPTSFLKKPNSNNSNQQQQQHQETTTPSLLPKPCSLESDPAFANPSTSSTTLSQHFTQHFTSLLRKSTNPHPTFLPHHHQDLLLPILAQTTAAVIGGAASLAMVLQLWRIIPGPIAVGFGSACLIGAGTWGFVWLGEEILDQLELWRERRRLERMMSEGWGRGAGGGNDESEG